MTWQEALKIKQNWTSEQARNDLERLILTGERPADKVVGLACQALDKQIPKKPIPFKRTAHDFCNGVCEHSHYPCEHLTIYNHEYQYTDYKCPLCNKRVSDGNPNNCCHCGQALDWSDAK